MKTVDEPRHTCCPRQRRDKDVILLVANAAGEVALLLKAVEEYEIRGVEATEVWWVGLVKVATARDEPQRLRTAAAGPSILRTKMVFTGTDVKSFCGAT